MGEETQTPFSVKPQEGAGEEAQEGAQRKAPEVKECEVEVKECEVGVKECGGKCMPGGEGGCGEGL
jgi:hypothetical protein